MGFKNKIACKVAGKVVTGYITGVRYIHIIKIKLMSWPMSRYNTFSAAVKNAMPNVKMIWGNNTSGRKRKLQCSGTR